MSKEPGALHVDDGAQGYTIVLTAASGDAGYDVLDPPDVTVTNLDDDTAGVSVVEVSGSGTTSEAGGLAVYTLALDSEPTANVSLAVSSSDPAEGTVSPSTLTFTTDDWSDPQTVTITGVNDDLDDGDKLYKVILTVGVSGDAAYSGFPLDDLDITNIDDDTDFIDPQVTIGVPEDGSIPQSLGLIEGTAEDSGTITSGVALVQLQITWEGNDGTHYVDKDGDGFAFFGGTDPVWLVAKDNNSGGPDDEKWSSWQFNSQNIWANNVTYTVKARARDGVGDVPPNVEKCEIGIV